MRTVLSASLFVLALAGFSPLASATEASPEPNDATTDLTPDGDGTAPAAAETGKDDAGGSAQVQPGANGDVMKNFTRHRPGACPEGPPCKVED
jgi:hypothetical protein